MTTLAISAILQISLVSTGANTYNEAHRSNLETGRPIMVLVGADWCPACRTMKDSVLPRMARRGLLKKVAFAVVNTDREGPLAHRLMQGGSIPQLIMYRKTSEGWKRDLLVGAQSEGAVESFIDRGVATTVSTVSKKE